MGVAVGMAYLSVLHGSNYLDTQAAGSYNRRPLSPGISAGRQRPLIFSICIWPLPLLCGPKGIYGDDDPINSYRPE